jgi:hypothetical protein
VQNIKIKQYRRKKMNMDVTVCNVFYRSANPENEKKNIIVIHNPELEARIIGYNGKKKFTLKNNEFLTIHVDSGSGCKKDHRVVYHDSFDGNVEFGWGGIGGSPLDGPHQHGQHGRRLVIPENRPTWRLIVMNGTPTSPLPRPSNGRGEETVEVEDGNVEVGDDNQVTKSIKDEE